MIAVAGIAAAALLVVRVFGAEAAAANAYAAFCSHDARSVRLQCDWAIALLALWL